MRRACLPLSLVLLVFGCPASKAPTAAPSTASEGRVEGTARRDRGLAAALDDAAGSAENEALRSLLREHWADTLRHSPVWASQLGVHDYDDRVSAHGPEAVTAWSAIVDGHLARARGIQADTLGEADAETLALFTEELEAAVAARACRFEQWSLSARGNPVTQWNTLPQSHPFEQAEDFDRFLARVSAIGPAIDGDVDNLRLGAADGLFANAESTRRVLEMVDRQLALPSSEWPIMAAATAHPDNAPADFAAKLAAELDEGVRPALVRYRDFIRDSVLPHARPDDVPGLASLPIAEACYAGRIRKFTTLSRTADEVHEVGLREIEKINAEMRELGKKMFGTKDLKKILHRLRSDEALFFDSAEEVERAAKDALADAKAKMPEVFGRLPRAECVVTPIPDYEAPFTTIAYYDQPHADGSKPGEYYINLYEPKTRPRYEARVLAVHESIPGHHLQIAIAQELEGLPAFRKHGGITVFVEGWGLYTERMAEEMGMYRDDLDRMGVLSFDAWRASRLVVDTGLHAKGWSREQAKQFMLEHTALAPNNIDNEVDRYITWPGQALAYKTGQLEIWRLRREAEAKLGDRFDVRGFHDAVLEGGAVTLNVLEKRVGAWIATTAAQ